MNFLTKSAVFLIESYQKWLSPRKGFKCAHGRHCEELTCSAYGKAMFRKHGFLTALIKTQQRIQACSEVAQLYRKKPPITRIATNQGGFVDADCSGCDAPDCGPCEVPDCSCNMPALSGCHWVDAADCGCDLAEGLLAFNKGAVFRVGPLKNGNDVYKDKASGSYFEVDPKSSQDWSNREVLSKHGLKLTKSEVKKNLGKKKPENTAS